MSKMSIDLFTDPEAKLLLDQETLVAVTSGCLSTLFRLGELGKLVEVFRVTFVRLGKEETSGPRIRVYYRDPLGTKTWHETDFRFMGSGSPTPSAKEIAETLYKDLSRFMREHLKRGVDRLSVARRAYGQLEKTMKYPLISPGTSVKTTEPNWSLRKEWTDEGWGRRRWNVRGTVITHHDSHGLCYDVRHEDGTVGSYDPSELEVVQ